MQHPLALLLPLALASLAPSTAAQTGPFVDGELLVRVDDVPGLDDTLFRIDPLTGDGEVFVDQLSGGYSRAGWIAYDSYRDGLLCYTAYVPRGTFVPRLYLVRSDGSITNLGFRETQLTALTPVGDGRVYLRRAGVLHLLGADNQMTPVLDDQGNPIDLALEHLYYDAGTNSLVGVSVATNTNVPCSAFRQAGLVRMTLDGAGTQLTAPPLCVPLSVTSFSPIGFDPLPSGDVLLCWADKNQFFTNDIFVLDPVTLAASVAASSSLGDVDGGVYCDPLGLVVLHDDVQNELKTYAAGQTGSGINLPVDVPLGGNQTGVSSAESFSDIDFQGPACGGTVDSYGVGTPGTNGAVPLLGAASCPALGAPLPFTVSRALLQATTVTVFGEAAATIPVLGGTLLVAPPFFATRVAVTDLDGFAQVALDLPNDASLSGVPFFAQVAVADPGATRGWAMSAGLQLTAQ